MSVGRVLAALLQAGGAGLSTYANLKMDEKRRAEDKQERDRNYNLQVEQIGLARENADRARQAAADNQRRLEQNSMRDDEGALLGRITKGLTDIGVENADNVVRSQRGAFGFDEFGQLPKGLSPELQSALKDTYTGVRNRTASSAAEALVRADKSLERQPIEGAATLGGFVGPSAVALSRAAEDRRDRRADATEDRRDRRAAAAQAATDARLEKSLGRGRQLRVAPGQPDLEKLDGIVVTLNEFLGGASDEKGAPTKTAKGAFGGGSEAIGATPFIGGILNRALSSKDENNLRRSWADVVSAVKNKRYGAALSAGEQADAEKFLGSERDSPETILLNMRGLARVFDRARQRYESQYNEGTGFVSPNITPVRDPARPITFEDL